MGVEDADKIIRIPGETLLIKLTPDEEKYRSKYLPDPKKLDDEKLCCTVCSVPLALDVHKGKDVFVHRALNVLVCKVCYDFYGDGCFSADEDGDDKYCRWCGQGGTLYLCSTCTCAFCQKCVKQNLKASVIAELEKDDWKCYICNPRPLFGSRTICWGANELNKIAKTKEQERLKKQKEKLEEKKKEENGRRSRKASSSEDELPKKRKARTHGSDSSSPEVMPTKRSKRDCRARIETGNVNGNINKLRRNQRDSSSDSESSEDKKRISKRGNSRKNKKTVDSSSDEYSDVKNKSKSKIKKKKTKESSEESSDEDKKKSKRKSIKKKEDSSDDEDFDVKHTKKTRFSRKKKEDSDSSSDEKHRKRKQKKKKKETSSEESSDDFKKKLKKNQKKKKEESSDSDDNIKKIMKKSKDKREHKVEVKKKSEVPDYENETKKEKKTSDDGQQSISNEKMEVNSKDCTTVIDNIVKKRIKLAILWLNNTVKDISELGSLISLRATKFGKKKINAENLKSYEDVLSTVNKLKQLMSGVHSNYDHIEKTLDAHLKPWKILTGLEETVDNEMHLEDETNKVVSEIEDTSTVGLQECNDEIKTDIEVISSDITKENKSQNKFKVEDNTECDKPENPSKTDNMSLHWSGLSGDEDSDNEEKHITDALISKASDVLDREESQKLESSENSDNGIEINKSDELKNYDKVNTDDKTVSNDFEHESVNNEKSKSRNSEDDSQTAKNDSDEVQTDENTDENITMSKESDTLDINILADDIKQNSEESVEKEVIKNTSPLVDKTRSDSESEIKSSPTNKTPEKELGLKEDEVTPEKECKENESKELTTKENIQVPSEGESETTGQ